MSLHRHCRAPKTARCLNTIGSTRFSSSILGPLLFDAISRYPYLGYRFLRRGNVNGCIWICGSRHWPFITMVSRAEVKVGGLALGLLVRETCAGSTDSKRSLPTVPPREVLINFLSSNGRTSRRSPIPSTDLSGVCSLLRRFALPVHLLGPSHLSNSASSATSITA